MSQVKNLRAMFENKEDTSPPDRGRSSGVSTPNHAGPYGTGSPRPLSKVRTSFVTVEKDGRMGLRRDPSGESSVSRRRLSNDTDIESISTMPDKPTKVPSDDGSRPARKLFVSEPIPESPRHLSENTDVFGGTPKDSTSAEPAAVASSTDNQSDADPKATTATVIPADKESHVPKSIGASGPETIMTIHAERPNVSAATAKPAQRPTNLTVKPDSTKSNETSKPPKTVKASSQALKKPDAKPSSKEATKSSTKQSTTSSPKPLSGVTGRASTTANKKPQILKTKASHDAGFTKPKPKSPTKPVSLPSSLTAPTASSVSKGNASRQSLSRQSGILPSNIPNGRPLSRASASTAGVPAKTVRRQPSTISRSRPSLGPPPKKASESELSTKKAQSQVDEGFLARMMRPTQASSSKVAEKTPVTPPRRSTQGASTSRTASGAKHDAKSKRVEANASPRSKRAHKDVQAQRSSVSGKTPNDTRGISPVPSGGTRSLDAEESMQAEHLSNLEADGYAKTSDKAAIDTSVTETATVETVEEAVELAHKTDQAEVPVDSETTEKTLQGPSTDAAAATETGETGPLEEAVQASTGTDEGQARPISTEVDDKQSVREPVAAEEASHGKAVGKLENESVLEQEHEAADIKAENPINLTQ